MDSISHTSMGVGISILAISSTQALGDYQTVAYASIIAASLIPDIDVVTKLAGNKSYINQHRGFTHSIVMFIIFTIILNLFSNIFLPDSGKNILLPWIAISVGMHIITDIFNNYGIKLLWPFKDKWLSVNATYTVDLVILSIFTFGILIHFLFKIDGVAIFVIALVFTITYLLALTIRRQLRIMYITKHFDKPVKKLYFASKSKPHHWKFVIETNNGYYYIGELHGNKIRIHGKQKKHFKIDNDIFKIIKHDKNLEIFRKFSKVYNWNIKRRKHITEVRLKDLTYYTKINKKYVYLFNCVIYINNDSKEIENTYVGFTTGDETLYKMVEHPTGFKNIVKKLVKRRGEIKG